MRKKQMGSVCSEKKNYGDPKLYNLYAVAACSTGIGIGWKAGIAAEVLGLPKNSIGKALYNAKIYLEMPDLFCWTAVIILLSLLFEKLAARLLHALTARLAVEREGQR